MQAGLVSIITPLYNGEKYVAQTIESVLAQTYPDWEMIVVNDGSTDRSAEIVQRYVEQDPRIKLFTQRNGGSASARNNGIRRAEGQYIALLDADARFRTTDGKRSFVAFPFMCEPDKTYGGLRPFRTYQGPIYRGGYSDHFPVLLDFEWRFPEE